MASSFPTSNDTATTLPNNRVALQTIPASDHNDLATAVINMQAKYGSKASAPTTVGQVLTVTAANQTEWQSPGQGTVTLAGDITGSGNGTITSTLAASGVSAGTYPNATVTVDSKGRVTSAAAGTTGPVRRVVTLPYASTITPNGATTDIVRVTLAGNPTIAIPSGTLVDGQKFEYHFIQDSTGSRTVTWAAGYKFAAGLSTPSLSASAGAEDVLAFVYDAASTKVRFYGIINGF